jgi:hypothetical protein
MTTEEFAKYLKGLAQAIKDNRVLYSATTATMDVVAERVWGRGELTDGSKLTYKGPTEKGMYFYSPPFPRKGSGKGKRGAKIKGTWAPSYKAAKDMVGRGDLPFELTGDMRKNWLGGPTPTPTEVDPLLVQIRVSQQNAKKIEGLSEAKGPFLKLSQEERELHVEHIREAFRTLVLRQ